MKDANIEPNLKQFAVNWWCAIVLHGIASLLNIFAGGENFHGNLTVICGFRIYGKAVKK